MFQTKLSEANATVLKLWAQSNGVSVQEIVGRIVSQACAVFLDGLKAQTLNPEAANKIDGLDRELPGDRQ